MDEYRRLLYNQFESGNSNLDKDLDLKNSHSRAKIAKDNRNNMRNALGIDAAFVDGSSLEKIKKASEALMKGDDIKMETDKDMEKSLLEKTNAKDSKTKRKRKERVV